MAKGKVVNKKRNTLLRIEHTSVVITKSEPEM